MRTTRVLRWRAALVFGASLTFAAPGMLASQRAPVTADSAREPGSELTVYLMTMGPGDAVWEKFGHNAIWIRNTATGLDAAYNWGIFDFNDADFIPRFLKGSMWYSMEPENGTAMINGYAAANRSVWVQELALTPAQKRELLEFVRWNARPENRFYHYDYFRDNCSTRVRDVIDRVLRGRLRAALDTTPTGTTYRLHTRRLTEGSVPIYTGMDLVLGPGGDKQLSAWDEAFLPMSLRDRIRAVSIRQLNGASIPLVQRELKVYEATRTPEPTAPANRLPGVLVAGALLGGLLALSGVAAARGKRLGRIAFVTLGSAWSLFAAIAGTVMALSWMLTDHFFMYRNENLLQFWPLSFVVLAMLPGLTRRRRRPEIVLRVAAAVAVASVVGLVVQLLPGLDQQNGEMIALALPAHLGLLWGVRALAVPESDSVPAGARAPALSS